LGAKSTCVDLFSPRRRASPGSVPWASAWPRSAAYSPGGTP